jgi:hypothetical protein
MWYNKFENNLKLIKAIKLNNYMVKKSWTKILLFLYNNLRLLPEPNEFQIGEML